MGIYDRPYYQDDASPSLAPSWDQRSAVATIIIICAGIFILNMIAGNRLNGLLALYSDDIYRPWMLWRTLSYGFVHSSREITHILFNMFSLWMLGRAVEERYGRAEFFRIYLVAIVMGGFIWLGLRLFIQEGDAVIGASGAVCCIEMLYVLNFPKATLFLFGVLPIQAWVLGVLLIGGNILTANRGDSGIAWDVHLVGIGLACAYFFGHWNFHFLASPLVAWRSWKRKRWGPKLRTYQPADRQAADEAEADRILDKIHRLGQDSLTNKERRFLSNYSKSVRNKRQNTNP